MQKRKILILLMLIMCVVMSSITVAAADDRLGTVVDGSLLTDNTEANLIMSPLEWGTYGTYLSYGTGSIYVNGYRNAGITGATNCYRNCDEVKVKLYLERLVGDSWENVDIVPAKSAYNTNYVSNSKSFSVAGGYYYRMTGLHIAIKDGKTETTSSYSDGIWFN